MSYTEPILDNDSRDTSHLDQIPHSGDSTAWSAVKILGLVVFFTIVLLTPGLLRKGDNNDDNATVTWTYISCPLNTTNNMCATTSTYSLYKSTKFEPFSANETIVARGYYDDILNATGWTTLKVESFSPFDDREQVNFAGFLEGYLTAHRITDVMTNENATMWNNQPEDAYDKLTEWFAQQQTYIQSQIDKNVYNNNNEAIIAPSEKHYWQAVELINNIQPRGMKEGYEVRLTTDGLPILYDLAFWSKRAEFGDTLKSIYPERTKNCWDMSDLELDNWFADEHCSSVSKTTLDLSNDVTCRPIKQHHEQQLMDSDDGDRMDTKVIKINDKVECTVQINLDFAVFHDTWTSFTDLIRIAKRYSFQINLFAQTHRTTSPIAIHPWTISMSSYPGLLTSYDDFYIMSSPLQQLVVTETTNTNCNKELWLKNSQRSISTTARTLIASLLATTANDWATINERENSGTYNNQWMIIDTKLFNSTQVEYTVQPYPSQLSRFENLTTETTFHNANELFFTQVTKTNYPTGFYVISEQVPGFVLTKDVTTVVNEQTYWRSFNRPYQPDVYIAMGFDKATEVLGDFYSYTDYARAQIMNRDLPVKTIPQVTAQHSDDVYPARNTTSLFDLMHYMRFNDWQNDPLSRKCSVYAIASRYDLIPTEGCGKPLTKPNSRGQTDVKLTTVQTVRHQYVDIKQTTIRNAILDNIEILDWELNNDAHKNDKATTSALECPHMNAIAKKYTTSDALFWLIAGPTNEQQHGFKWEGTQWEHDTHVGHPKSFEFEWVQLNH